MGQLQEIEPQLTQGGYHIIAVSADRPEKLPETVDRHNLNFLLLSDSKMMGAQAFGLAYKVSKQVLEYLKKSNVALEEASGEKRHILPVPAVFITGTDGIIRFEYVNPNHTVRLNPEILLTAARVYKTEKR